MVGLISYNRMKLWNKIMDVIHEEYCIEGYTGNHLKYLLRVRDKIREVVVPEMKHRTSIYIKKTKQGYEVF